MLGADRDLQKGLAIQSKFRTLPRGNQEIAKGSPFLPVISRPHLMGNLPLSTFDGAWMGSRSLPIREQHLGDKELFYYMRITIGRLFAHYRHSQAEKEAHVQ